MQRINYNNPGTEEEIIYEIVDNILSTQDKIKDIQYSIQNIDQNTGLGFKLLNLKKEIKNNISSINELKNEISDKESRFNEYKIKHNIKIKKIDNEILEKEEKLRKISLNQNEEIYKISYEKIENIIKKKKDSDELKKISIEYNSTENAKRNLDNLIKDKINEREEITERLLMLREEKNNLKEQIINLISEKESIEELYKLYIMNINNNLNEINGGINSNLYEKNNTSNNYVNVNLFHFEICKININKCTNEISNILIKFCNMSKTNINVINEYDESYINLLKSELFNIIQNDLVDFIQLNNKVISSKKIEKFFISLSNKIINKIQIEISNEKIVNLLKYIIKVNYYETIIINDLNFINKEYKILKRENQKLLNEKQNEINQLINKENEIEFLLNQIKEKKEVLIEKNAYHLVDLSPEEKEYFNINEKINQLINEKKELEYNYDEKYECLKMIIEEINDKINQIKKQNEILENEIDNVNNNIKKENERKKKEIEKLKESIKEKFKMIKVQLTIYKRKHGNNMELYDKFVEKINLNLRLSSKSLLNNDSLSNSSYMNSIIFSPSNESKNNSLIFNNSKTIFRNNNLGVNSISTNSIFSPFKVNYIINNRNNGLINSSSLPYFSPIKSRNIEYNIFKSDKKMINNNNNNENINYGNNENEIINKDKKQLWEEEKKRIMDSMKLLNKEKIIFHNKSYSKLEINKNIIENNESLKYSNLINTINCFYRIIKENNKKFDPLEDKDKINEFDYEKISMRINENFTHLIIFKDKSLLYQIPIEKMETTIVNNNIKYIIKIFQKYKSLIKKNGFVEMNNFLNLKDFQNIPFDNENIKKAALNNLFNIQLSFLNNGYKERIEFIFLNYDDVKLWLNGLNYIIKNKSNNKKENNLNNIYLRNFIKSK